MATGTLMLGSIADVVCVSTATAMMGGAPLVLALMGFVAVPSLRPI